MRFGYVSMGVYGCVSMTPANVKIIPETPNASRPTQHAPRNTLQRPMLYGIAFLLVGFLLGTPAPFDLDGLIEALEEENVEVVHQDEAPRRVSADACMQVTTVRSARFTACTYPSTADARSVAYQRSDYERSVFQRGEVVVFLRRGASTHLSEAVQTVTKEP